jgi:hypothetical protein
VASKHTLDYCNAPPEYKVYRKRNLEKFGFEIEISEAQFIVISMKPCHYCGKNGPNGIDRMDNDKPYALLNCLPCCKHCNYVKGNLSLQHFEEWKRRFVKHQVMLMEMK